MAHMGISLLNQLKLMIANKNPDSSFSWKWEHLVSWGLSWPELSGQPCPSPSLLSPWLPGLGASV